MTDSGADEIPDGATDRGTAFAGRAMGSALRLTIGGRGAGATDSAVVGSDAWDGVVESFEISERAMSRFRDTSELTTLNHAAGTERISRPSVRLRRALVAADRAHRVTGGRFDPRVLADLDRLGYRGAALTTEWAAADPSTAPADPSERRVVDRVGRDGFCIARPIDLGGIGKGLALRWAAAELQRGGVSDFLLEAGGDLVARGLDPGGGPWLVGIEDPTESIDHLAVIAVADEAVTTSSIRVHRWAVDGRAVHHLLDPRTGEPAEGGLLSVTVAGPDPAWAEVWSKVLFVGGRAAIAGEARARGLAAWWVTDDGSFEMTADARWRTVWVAAEDDPEGTAS
jgi:thiamine biosynthesis lipoprotein